MVPRTQFKNMDVYIRSFPPDIQKFWSDYGRQFKNVRPMQKKQSITEYPLSSFTVTTIVHFAAFKHHIGFYPTPSAINAFHKELSPYRHAKGSIQFPIDKPIPFDLVREIVIYRVKESVARGKTKR